MNKKLIVLNGPPRCGKDTLADFLADEWGMAHLKFAGRLKQMTHGLYGVPMPAAINQFESCKDEPNPSFFGLTPRQAYIAVSEAYIKPVHGKDFFGKRLLEKINQIPKNLFVASDGGLIEELIPVVEGLGGENVLVLKISRPGCNFEGDSRSYYPTSTLKELSIDHQDLLNDGSLQEFLDGGREEIEKWLEENS